MDNPYAAATEVADKPATVNGASPKPTSEHPMVGALCCMIGSVVGLQVAIIYNEGLSSFWPVSIPEVINLFWGSLALGGVATFLSTCGGWLWSTLLFDYKRHFVLQFLHGFLFANSVVYLEKLASSYLVMYINWITDLLAGSSLDDTVFVAFILASVFSQTVESILSRAIFPDHPRRRNRSSGEGSVV